MSASEQPTEKITANPDAPGVSNPIGGSIQVVVTVPERVTIKMVDASSLGEYEYHGAITAAVLSITTGFLVPAIQEIRAGSSLGMPFLVITIFFLAILVASAIMTWQKRAQVRKGGKEIELQTSGAKLI